MRPCLRACGLFGMSLISSLRAAHTRFPGVLPPLIIAALALAMDSSTIHRRETFSFFPRDIRSFKLGRAAKSRSRTFDGRATATSVPSSPAHGCTPVLSRLPASIQHLPVEIVLNILSFALPSLYDDAFGFRLDPNAFFDAVEGTPSFRRVLKDTQACLHSAALVCRSWYPAATEFLYGCPFLYSPAGIAALSRTLERAPLLRHLVKELWLFNEEGAKLSDPLGNKRKNMRRIQASLTGTLRTYTSLDAFIVCNHGLMGQDNARENFPIDNVIVYGLPSSLPSTTDAEPYIPSLALYGPSFFNQPWTRHAKPHNLVPEQLTRLCMRDIGPSPAQLKCAPYLPTLPRLHTLQLALLQHDDAPVVSAGTLPALRTLEVYRAITAPSDAEHGFMRSVPVEDAVLAKLERLHFVGRAVEAMMFRRWAESQLFEELRELAVGPLSVDELEFLEDWRLPDKLEVLQVVVVHRTKDGKKLDEGDASDARNAFRALYACVHRNRQARSFKKLVVRSVDALSPSVLKMAEELGEKCVSHKFAFEMHVGGE